MGYALRYFIAEEDGLLTRVPAVTYDRWFAGDEAMPVNRAGRELKVLEVVVEVERRRLVDVRRILPVRHQVRDDGRLDVSATMRQAQKRLDILWRLEEGDASARIDQLEVDANAFWWPADIEIEALGTALLGPAPSRSQLMELRAAVFRPGNASRGG